MMRSGKPSSVRTTRRYPTLASPNGFNVPESRKHPPPGPRCPTTLAKDLQAEARLAHSFRGMSAEERQRIIQRVADLASNAVEYYKA